MLSSGVGGTPIMDIECRNNVLVVAVTSHSNSNVKPTQETMMTVVTSPEYEYDSDVQRGTLMHFHRRLEHPCSYTIV